MDIVQALECLVADNVIKTYELFVSPAEETYVVHIYETSHFSPPQVSHFSNLSKLEAYLDKLVVKPSKKEFCAAMREL